MSQISSVPDYDNSNRFRVYRSINNYIPEEYILVDSPQQVKDYIYAKARQYAKAGYKVSYLMSDEQFDSNLRAAWDKGMKNVTFDLIEVEHIGIISVEYSQFGFIV